MNTPHAVTLYAASSSQLHPDYVAAAQGVGAELAQRGIRTVYGAGNQGLMAAAANAALAEGGEVLGVIPHFMQEEGWHHTGLTELRVVEDMHQRKAMMAAEGQGVIALAGGCGTLEELLEIITWKQLGLYLHPIVILNTRGYYDGLIMQLQRAIDEHFMRPQHAAMWVVATTPQEAVDALFEAPMWSGNLRKIAAI